MSRDDQRFVLAVSLARAAGEVLLERFRGPASGVATKTSPTDLVSDADRDAEELILGRLRDVRPEDGVVGEEGARFASTSGTTWTIDPLDGTVNFLFGIPTWCVSIAVASEDGFAAGAIFDPTHDEMFAAVRGKGAWLNDEPISVGERSDLERALIGTGFAYEPEVRAAQAGVVARILPRVRDIRRAGSAALDLASLACGRLDGFYEAHMEEWDKAAGVLIVEEAGGVVSPLPNPRWDRSHGVVAGNRVIHDALRRALFEQEDA